jgi:2'-5' RNA ligase
MSDAILGGHAVMLQLLPLPSVDALVEHWIQEKPLNRSPPNRRWHVTIAHVGRDLSVRAADIVLACARAVGDMRPTFVTMTGATAMFGAGDHLVARLELTPVLRALHDGLVTRLEASGIAVSKTYDFNPHVTLALGRGVPAALTRRTVPVLRVIVKRGEDYLEVSS